MLLRAHACASTIKLWYYMWNVPLSSRAPQYSVPREDRSLFQASARQSAGARHLPVLPLSSSQQPESQLGEQAKGSLATSRQPPGLPCVPHGQVLPCMPPSLRQLLTTKLLACFPSHSLAGETLKPWEVLGTGEQTHAAAPDKKPRTLRFCFQYECLQFSSNTDTVIKSTEVETPSWVISSAVLEASSEEESTAHLAVVVWLSGIYLFTLFTLFF